MTNPVTVADDYFHKRNDDPYWNESGWFGFNVPDRELAGCVYIHQRPNRGYAWAGLILWDPSGKQIYDCLWHDYSPQHLPAANQLPEESKVFEFTTPRGLTARNPEPLKRYEFSYANGPCTAELEFDTFAEPHDAGLAGGWDEWGSRHYEQGGRMRGQITLHGDRIDVDCLTLRDRSWGPHSASGLTRGAFSWGVASEDLGFGVQPISQYTADQDPIFGTTEPVLAGWLRRDGTTSHVRSGEHTVERDATGAPVAIHLTGTDELGRDFTAEGRCVNLLNFTAFGTEIFWHWSLTEWTIDGQTAWGEEQDVFDGTLRRRLRARS